MLSFFFSVSLSLFLSVSFDVLLFFSFIFLSFFLSVLNWIMTSFFHFYVEREKKMEFVTSVHLSNWINKKKENLLFWNARRKLARVNSNTLQLRSVHVHAYTKQGFWHTHTCIHSYRDSLTCLECEETKTDNKRMCVMACDEVIRIYIYIHTRHPRFKFTHTHIDNTCQNCQVLHIHNVITWRTIEEMIHTKKKENVKNRIRCILFSFSFPLEQKSIVNCIFYQLKIKLTNIFPNHFSISFII
jgi:hypothetical protein